MGFGPINLGSSPSPGIMNKFLKPEWWLTICCVALIVFGLSEILDWTWWQMLIASYSVVIVLDVIAYYLHQRDKRKES